MAKQKKVLFSWALCALATICFIAAAGVSQRGVRAADDVFYFAESAEDIDITSTLGTLTSINGYVGPAFLTKSPSLVDDGDAASGKAVKIIFHNWAATGTYRPLLFSEAKSIDELNSLSIRIKAHLSSASTYQTAFGGVRLFASDSDGTGGYMLPADIVQDEWIVLTLNKEQLALLADADGKISGLQAGSACNFGSDNNQFYATPEWSAHILIDTVYAELDLYYNVTFDTMGGTSIPTQSLEKTGQTAVKPADPVREGYIFAGWKSSGVTFDFSTVITSDTTITAQWVIMDSTLTTARGDYTLGENKLTHINGTLASGASSAPLNVVAIEGSSDGSALKFNFHSWNYARTINSIMFQNAVSAADIDGLQIRIYLHLSASNTYNTSFGGVRLYGANADGTGPGYMIPANATQDEWIDLNLTREQAEAFADSDGVIRGLQIISAQWTSNPEDFHIGAPGEYDKSAYIAIDWIKAVSPFNVVSLDYSTGINAEDKEFERAEISLYNTDKLYTYQYWIKQNIAADKNTENLAATGAIWQLVQGYSPDRNAFKTLEMDEVLPYGNFIDANGNITVLIRAKDTDGSVKEFYKVFTREAINMPYINAVYVNGRHVAGNGVALSEAETLRIVPEINIAVDSVSLQSGRQLLSSSLSGGAFNISAAELSTGYNKLSITAQRDGKSATTAFTVYIYRDYNADEVVVIDSVEYADKADGSTDFILNLSYANGDAIADGSQGFDVLLTSGKLKGIPNAAGVVGGKLTVNVPYDGKYGIYQTTIQTTSADNRVVYDKAVRYYKYGDRAATADFTVNGNSGTTFEITDTSGVSIAATQSTKIVGADSLIYEFYREDATGWTLIKLGTSGELDWQPSRSGTYRISMRVRDANSTVAASYEAEVSKQITVILGGSGLSGDVEIVITDYRTGDVVTPGTALESGVPYIFTATYTGNDKLNVLYMFTFRNSNLGTIYLNKFSPSQSVIFIPNKADNSINIEARVIDVESFGFKDTSFNMPIHSVNN